MRLHDTYSQSFQQSLAYTINIQADKQCTQRLEVGMRRRRGWDKKYILMEKCLYILSYICTPPSPIWCLKNKSHTQFKVNDQWDYWSSTDNETEKWLGAKLNIFGSWRKRYLRCDVWQQLLEMPETHGDDSAAGESFHHYLPDCLRAKHVLYIISRWWGAYFFALCFDPDQSLVLIALLSFFLPWLARHNSLFAWILIWYWVLPVI